MAVAESDLGSIKSMFEHMEDAVIVTTADLDAPGPNIVFVNRSFSELTGYAPGEILGKTPRILQGSSRISEHISRLREDLRTKRHFYGEVVNRRKNGSEYAARCQIVPYLDGVGDVLYWINIQRDITPLARERRNRKVAETTYRSLVENQSDLICQFRPDTTLGFANAAYAHFVGLAPEDVSENRFADFFGDEERRHILIRLETLTPEQPFMQHEGCFADKDGHSRWIAWRTTALFDADGQLLRYQAAGTDITERKRAEEALKESNRHLKAILNNVPDIAWLKDVESRFIAVNEAFATACGTSPMDLVGKRDLDIWPEDLARNYLADDQEIIRTGKRKIIEERLVDHSGNETWIETIKTPILSENNAVVGTAGIARDITKHKRLEAALRESERRVRAITDALPARISFVNRDRRYQFTNKTYETFFGLEQKDLIGRHIKDVLGKNKYKEIAPYVARALSGHKVRYESIHYINGKACYQDVIYVPEFDEAGLATGFYALINDITDRKLAEAALLDEKERAQVTLHSIGDAVITTNAGGIVAYLNPVAEALTGWRSDDARGLALEKVFRIIDEDSREPAPDPVTRCLREGKIVGLANHSVLIDRNGKEYAIEDTAAPIRGRDGGLLGAVLVFHDVSETRSMARQLAHDASHDSLTGLINRREFEKRLQRAVLSAKQHGSRHMLCYMDLDQFKLINDTAGHSAGDELLKRVRGLLSGKFRERDTLGRLGGDEFGLLLNNCDPEEAQAICDVIVAAFRDYRFKWQGRTFQVGVSIGLVAVTADAVSADQLLGQADVACYTAKELGRNQIHLYQMEGAKLSLRHSEIMLASGLQDALEQHRFRLYCQPIVELSAANGQPTRYELLLRLLDKGEVLSPIAFIPAAERYGLMNAIDRWVIRKAFQSYKEIFSADSGVEIAINLSGNSLGDDSFLEFLVEQFSRFSMRPQSVCFEITETAAITNLNKAADLLKKIKQAGAKLALDDFGAGLSSFTYLKSFPADYLKIDGSFVHDMADSSVDSAMVEAINQVGHTLGMTTIAECVQCDAVVDRLRALGVNWAQGNALGAPMPLDELRGRVTIN